MGLNAQGIVNAIRYPILVLVQKFKVGSATPAFLDTFRLGLDETVGYLLCHPGNGQGDFAAARRASA